MVSAPPIQSKEPSPPSESIPSLDSDHAAISDGTEGADTIPPPLHKGEVVIITASSGNGGYLGVPGLKAQVYENRRAYAERWGKVPNQRAENISIN